MHPACRELPVRASGAERGAIKCPQAKHLRQCGKNRLVAEGECRQWRACKTYPRNQGVEAVDMPVFTIAGCRDLRLKNRPRCADPGQSQSRKKKNSAQQKTAGRLPTVLSIAAAGAVCFGRIVCRELVGDVRQQGHEAGALDCGAYGVLAGGRAAALPTTDDLALPADELRKQLKILVIDEHRARTLAVDEDRVFPLGADRCLTAFAGRWTTAGSAAAATETHCSIQLSQANRRRSGTSCELRSVPKRWAGVKASSGVSAVFWLPAATNPPSVARKPKVCRMLGPDLFFDGCPSRRLRVVFPSPIVRGVGRGRIGPDWPIEHSPQILRKAL